MILKNKKSILFLSLSSLFLLFGCTDKESDKDKDNNTDSALVESTSESNLNNYNEYVNLESILNAGYAVENYLNDYNLNWWSYKVDGVNSLLLSDKKGSYYSNNSDVNYYGVRIGDNSQSVKKLLGEPLEYYKKGNNLYDIKSEEYFSYEIEGNYVTYFFDNVEGDVVKNVLIIPVSTENSKDGYYNEDSGSETYISSLENLMVELINSDRRNNGLKELIYDKTLNSTARNHSQDMINNNYFAHENLKGESVKDRMIADGFRGYSLYGENIAYGQFNSIYAHEALMNSEGHRKNILEERYSHVGVGVAINSDNLPYFTINFYSK